MAKDVNPDIDRCKMSEIVRYVSMFCYVLTMHSLKRRRIQLKYDIVICAPHQLL